ncbi:hypothetical protein [Flavobacterium tegetincola]|uniref:hypothetical protein n=1 Tax=Flavobacterium tegetincola TaxID=150172 RepID=UPI00047E4287|nr:hypothetical protein [Flavobacterium tegetincola]
MKATLLIIFLFICSVCFAQKKTFTNYKKFGVVIDRLVDFQRLVSVEDSIDSANEVDKYDLFIKIYNEKYGSSISDNYLKVDYIKPTTSAIITSIWEVKLEEVAEKKIKVRVSLLKVIPDENVKGNVTIKEKASSGKFENELEYFLYSKPDIKTKID